MLRKVKVSPGMNSLHFLKPKWKAVFNINCSIGIMRQFIVFVEPVVLTAKTQSLMPVHAGSSPFLKPFRIRTRTNKELHFHLFKFTHTENKLTGNNLVTESFTDLGNPEWNLHTASFLYIQVIDKNTLCRFRTKINL